MSGQTPGGLPYPTTTDRLVDTDDWIGALADAAALLIASPGIVRDQRTVTCDGSGNVWIAYPQLVRLDGVVPVVYGGGGNYMILPIIQGLSENAALVKFLATRMNTADASVSNWTGPLTVSSYAWGQPA